MSSIKTLNILNYKFKVFSLLSLSISLFVFSLSSYALAKEETLNSEVTVYSDYCTIVFGKGVNLRTVDRNLNTRFININSVDKKLLNNTKDLSKRITLKCDIILLKSEQIVDMYPDDFHVKIVIYKDEEEMIDVYERITGKREDLYFFYVYETNTIYSTQTRINQNVLTHEIGHAIVNHYFIIRPPEIIRELISQYMDVHLED